MSPAPPPVPLTAPQHRIARILIVDDSAVMRTLLRSVVSSDARLEVAGTASDGASALLAVDSVQPDLVLLDVEMPGMDGLNTLKQMRVGRKPIPVIMCSALTQRGAKVTIEALASGAADYVAKPSGQSSKEDAMQTLAHNLIPKILALTASATMPKMVESTASGQSRSGQSRSGQSRTYPGAFGDIAPMAYRSGGAPGKASGGAAAPAAPSSASSPQSAQSSKAQLPGLPSSPGLSGTPVFSKQSAAAGSPLGHAPSGFPYRDSAHSGLAHAGLAHLATTHPANAHSAIANPAIANPAIANPAIANPAIVVLGVSTGGPAALDCLLPAIPADFSLPILIVQHMPELFTGMLAERLNSRCPLRVCEATSGEPIRGGTVYIARGGWHMEVAPSIRALPSTQPNSALQAAIRLTQDPPENHCRPAVDVLFRTAVGVFGPRVLGVILTGMGSDGLIGSRLIRERGGIVLAQDQATSAVWGMPGAVAQAGLAQRVLPLNALVAEILRLAGRGQHEAHELREPTVIS